MSAQMYFAAWRLFTEEAIKAGDHASEHHRFAARRALMHMWHRAAQRLHADRVVAEAITARMDARIRQATLTMWYQRVQVRSRAPDWGTTCY
jgi:hypothetical protein